MTIMLMIHLTQETLTLNIMGKFGKEKLTQKNLKLKITKNKKIITIIKLEETKAIECKPKFIFK
ncbi:hypothetical protein XBFFL1_1640055 [Xenorhabdus bovienii str. feltiae Florida]|uniref:Uncharacterized protein n=1 Tax=Xenorhabdus bovienii str. feltiae Moldova TaxID=1398200 RepID=A0A077NN31_XENBV|nr:hypothetical protein XBFFR1_1990025 [Xenorhabdus bovienii str. feltiae France]CDG91543.1 hypothetical protein XBFFL1_1640055 [Xenorhabdus bovienii str. feltiae Florida]CDG99803.1 hypothetical protein XBFM1_120010 [Xenorhabdus bovienii str. feltiae Moldova]